MAQLIDASGVVVFEGEIVGHGMLTEYVIPFAFNTPGIVAGVVIYTPTAGDRCGIASAISISEAFDGTTPRAYVASQGEDGVQSYMSADATTVDVDHDAAGHVKAMGGQWVDMDYFADATPLILAIDDGNGGDPNDPVPMTLGAGEIRFVVISKGTTP